MKRLIVAGAVTAALAVGGSAAAYAATSQAAPVLPSACVKFGVHDSILGNYMLWNWNNSVTCPAGTYPVWFSKTITVIKPTVTVTPTVTHTVTVTPTPTVSPTPTGTGTTTAPVVL